MKHKYLQRIMSMLLVIATLFGTGLFHHIRHDSLGGGAGRFPAEGGMEALAQPEVEGFGGAAIPAGAALRLCRSLFGGGDLA